MLRVIEAQLIELLLLLLGAALVQALGRLMLLVHLEVDLVEGRIRVSRAVTLQ